MTYIAPRVEALARAMCVALKHEPDKLFGHGYNWQPFPTIDRSDVNAATPDIWLHSPNWMQFAWQAQQWIYEHSGGELPEREGEG